MKQVMMYAFAVLVLAGANAHAQGTVEVRDDVTFTTNDITESPQTLSFGFSSNFTDSTDFDKGETILPPFMPPDGFFAFFAVKDALGSEDFAKMDVRGVPDSVKQGVTFFSQVYKIRLQRYRGQDVSINFAFPFRRGMDSVVFESTQPGANYRVVFTDRGKKPITNSLITTLQMTVYYNYNRAAAVPGVPGADKPLSLFPNPARRGMSAVLAAPLPAGTDVMVSNVQGQVVARYRMDEAAEAHTLPVTGLPAGVYFVRALSQGGTMLGAERLVVTE